MPTASVLPRFGATLHSPIVHDASFIHDADAPSLGGLAGQASRRAHAAIVAALARPDGSYHPRQRLVGNRRANDYGSFLRVGKVIDTVSSTTLIHPARSLGGARSDCSDFLFHDASSLVLSPQSKMGFSDDVTPKMAMMQGAVIATTAETCCDRLSKSAFCKFVDITRSDVDDEGDEKMTGWCKLVPRGIRITLAFDIIGAITLFLSRGALCDQPLRTWIVGGMLLGLPTTWLVNKVAKCQPDYQFYRVRVLKTRGGGDSEDFQLQAVKLYDRMGALIPDVEAGRPPMVQNKEALGCWRIDVGQRTLITGYQLVTHGSDNERHDPAAWRFEGSYDGLFWELVDEETEPVMPRGRGVEYERMEELMHLEDSAAVFRTAFALEVLANVASFAWLVQGTSWVTAGANECVDGAPTLFYSCYLIVVTCWSLLGTITMGLIVSAVAMVVLGMRAPQQGPQR